MATDEADEVLLPKRLAMPLFASDPLSSVAYATEGALIVLITASATSTGLIVPLSIAIALLLAIVVISYRQTIFAYPSGGGAYVVARDNLGTLPALLAAAALLVDYVLTVAVSIVAGVVAVASAYPPLAPHAVAASIVAVAILHVANLRGLRESGYVFALPTYAFVGSMFVMLAVGIGKGLTSGWPAATVPDPLPAGSAEAVGLFVLLKAFASGCAALTGVEAISNGVTAFRAPQSRNAAFALSAMGAIAIVTFLGVSILAWKMEAAPSESVSVLSEVARATFPADSPLSFGFYAVQATTFAVLFLAANAAFQGFPRLAALMARDGYMPRQFQNLGDRLVYSNGLTVLTLAAVALIVAFDADVESLVHLYLLGVFTAFTLSQLGMVRMWWRGRETLGRRTTVVRLAMNGAGALTTGIVTVVIVATKFAEGAWMVTVAVPLIVAAALAVHVHYREVRQALDSGYELGQRDRPGPTVLVVPGIDDATLEALRYTESLFGGDFQPVHVAPSGHAGIARVWSSFQNDYPGGVPELQVLARRGSSVRTLVEHVRHLPRSPGEFVTVVIPELFQRANLRSVVERREALALRLRLLGEPGVVVTDVPILAGSPETQASLGRVRRMVVVAPISTISDASLRALDYASSIAADEAHALYVDLDAESTGELRSRWEELARRERAPGLDLRVLPSPYRDLGAPIVAEIRSLTADPDTVCMVVMPELVVTRWWQRLLHNQRAFFLKRILLFEERVIVTSVPLVLDRALEQARRPATPEPTAHGGLTPVRGPVARLTAWRRRRPPSRP
jgi:amino acid transporter